MADYKVIHRAEGAEIPWEPGCPVALTAVQVSRNTETSEAWLQAKARNVSDAEAGSVYADLSLEYADGTGETIPAEFLDADVPAGAERPLKPRRLPRGDVQSCSLTVRRVEGPDGTWESTGEASPLPSPEKLSLSPRAFSQRVRAIGANAGDSVLHGKVQDHDGWWACACGQVNVRRESCCSCGNPKERLMANEDEAALLADADEHDDAVLAEAKKLQDQGSVPSLTAAIEKYEALGDYKGANEFAAQCNEKLSGLKEVQATHRKTITRRALIGCAGLATVAGGVALFTNVIEPAWKRQQAEKALAAGNFEEAESLYLEIDDLVGYNKALNMQKEAENLQIEAEGDAALASGDYATAVDKYVDAGKNDKANEARYAYVLQNRSANDRTTFTYLSVLKDAAYEDSVAIYDELFAWSFDIGFAVVYAADTHGFPDRFLFADGFKWPLEWMDVDTWERGGKDQMVFLLIKANSGPFDASEKIVFKVRKRKASYSITNTPISDAGEWGDWKSEHISDITVQGGIHAKYLGSDPLYDAFSVKLISDWISLRKDAFTSERTIEAV